MARYLIVANQTLGGHALELAVVDRAAGADGRFHVLVPATAPEVEVTQWMPADPVFGVPPLTGTITDDARDEARRRSEHRLARMLETIERLGGTADGGEVGDPDPVRAVESLLAREAFDEVLVSTLPAGISRWIRMDLCSRLRRVTDTPVTVVEADEDEQPG